MKTPNVAAARRLPDGERAKLLCGPERDTWIEAFARYGFAEAQVLFGQLLLDRRPRPPRGTAFGWFAAAAAAGHPPGINMKGRCLERGWDVDTDPVAAAECYRHAAALGDGWAQFNLGCVLLYGIGTGRDRPAAFEWFTRAADYGNAKALNMLGRFHEEGWDRPVCRSTAADLYRRAALAGDFRGQFNVASLLHGQGQVAEAVSWLRRAISAGSPDFLQEVGLLLASSNDPALRAVATEANNRIARQL